MTWGKIDDNLPNHPKVIAAGNAAMGLWVRALSWSCKFLTDGLIPPEVIPTLGGTQAEADRLVKAGLWHEHIDGYQFHDWAEYQPTRAQVEAKRAETAGRVAKWRSGKESNAVTGGVTNAAPVPVPEKIRAPQKTTRGTRLSPDFTLDADLLSYTLDKAPSIDVKVEIENFRDHWAAASGAKGVKLDWRAAWRTWVRRAHGWNVDKGWKPAAAKQDAPNRLNDWLAARGVSLSEYERRKNETGWLESLKEIK